MGRDLDDTGDSSHGYLKIALQLIVIAMFVLLIVYFMRKYGFDL